MQHSTLGTHLRHHVQKLTESEFARILILRTIGNFLVFTSIFFIGKTLYKPVFEEAKYLTDRVQGKQYVVAEDVTAVPGGTPRKGELNRLIQEGRIIVMKPQDTDFSIIIPKIGANSRIIPNVDAADEGTYLPVLQEGVAHAAGTSFPGEPGHIFMFAHSTDYFWNTGTYNAIFYLLYKLDKGDEIDLFYKGKRHVYKVTGSQVVDPSQVEYLTRKTKKEFLTLQTCWPLGTTLKRLLIFAAPVGD